MIDFVWCIITDLKTMKSDCHRFCFIVDNLQSHHNQQMVAFIITQGHRLIFRAPYYPVDGPIEYVSNTIQGVLRIRNHLITDVVTLQNEIDFSIDSIPLFAPYFIRNRIESESHHEWVMVIDM